MANIEDFDGNVHLPQFDWAQIQQKVDKTASWITDEDARNHIVSTVLTEVQQRIRQLEVPPKNPSYWLARTINAALRRELRRREIRLPNILTPEIYQTITQLVAKRVRKDLQDKVVDQIFERLKREAKPVENLEHWTNKIIFHCLVDEIKLQTGKSGVFKWQTLKETAGKKEDVERELAAHYAKAKAGEVVDVEFLPDTREMPDSDLQPEPEPEEQHVDYRTMAALFKLIWLGNTCGSVLVSKHGLTGKATRVPFRRQEQVWVHFGECAKCHQKWEKLVDEQLSYEMDIADQILNKQLEEDEEFRRAYAAAGEAASRVMERRVARRKSGMAYERILAEDEADMIEFFQEKKPTTESLEQPSGKSMRERSTNPEALNAGDPRSVAPGLGQSSLKSAIDGEIDTGAPETLTAHEVESLGDEKGQRE